MSTEIKHYLDKAHQDLQAAKYNLLQGFYWVAVSRAYYAMFYAASALLASKGIYRRRHSGVISAFAEHFVKPGLIEPEYAKMLSGAFESRLDSDYDVWFNTSESIAKSAVSRAMQFISRIEEYLKEKELL